MKIKKTKLNYKKFIIAFGIAAITTTNAYSAETFSFKGIKFGMNAAEIAHFGGGETTSGCEKAIKSKYFSNNYDKTQIWTYAGIDNWTALCMEDLKKDEQIPGISGLIEMSAYVCKRGMCEVTIGYSFDELVEIFSKVFGQFQIETFIVKNGLGQEFEKKRASAYAKTNDAIILIADRKTGEYHDTFINIKIFSKDYIEKQTQKNSQQNNQKLNDSKNDF